MKYILIILGMVVTIGGKAQSVYSEKTDPIYDTKNVYLETATICDSPYLSFRFARVVFTKYRDTNYLIGLIGQSPIDITLGSQQGIILKLASGKLITIEQNKKPQIFEKGKSFLVNALVTIEQMNILKTADVSYIRIETEEKNLDFEIKPAYRALIKNQIQFLFLYN